MAFGHDDRAWGIKPILRASHHGRLLVKTSCVSVKTVRLMLLSQVWGRKLLPSQFGLLGLPYILMLLSVLPVVATFGSRDSATPR